MGSKSKGPMKCHYEVLDVPKDASDDDIKKSYRKKALKYHPDKNPENIEECTRIFHLLQTAYDVLSDPQERAWYDKHREAILKGGLGHGETYDDKSLNVYEYFNTSCYSGYGDDENGFYAVYREVFETIADEDMEFKDDDDSDNEMPGFGDSQSSYEEEVHAFYSYWESYCTSKSYVWVEQYDTREGVNRQMRRAMEAENKKLREKARKERNDEVRTLVSFVRKRDRRVQAYKKKLEERAAQVALQAAERKTKAKKQRLKDMADYQETAWAASNDEDLAQLEAKMAAHFGEDEDEWASAEEGVDGEEEEVEEEPIYDELFCVACNKPFRTEKQFVNHEGSKKHKEAVARLKEELAEEEDILEGLGLGSKPPADEEILTDEEEEKPKQKLSKKQKKKRRQQQKAQQEEEEEEEDEDEPELLEQLESLGISKDKKAETEPESKTAENGDTSVDNEKDAAPLGESAAESVKGQQTTVEATGDAKGDAKTPTGDKAEGKETKPQQPSAATAADSETTEATSESKPTRGKKKSQANQQTQGIVSNCNTCGSTFPSKSKLFDHLTKTGHAKRIDGTAPSAPEPEPMKAKKGKRKGKR